MAAMLHASNNTILFLWDKMFILMQNIFIVPGMQHGRHAKPLYLLSPLRAWVHIRHQPEIATVFGQQLVVPGGPMSSLCPSSFFPCPPCFFRTTSFSVDITGPSEGGSRQGCRCHAKHMADPFPSLSLYMQCDCFGFCNSAQLVVCDNVRPEYSENPSQTGSSGRLLVCG